MRKMLYQLASFAVLYYIIALAVGTTLFFVLGLKILLFLWLGSASVNIFIMWLVDKKRQRNNLPPQWFLDDPSGATISSCLAGLLVLPFTIAALFERTGQINK